MRFKLFFLISFIFVLTWYSVKADTLIFNSTFEGTDINWDFFENNSIAGSINQSNGYMSVRGSSSEPAVYMRDELNSATYSNLLFIFNISSIYSGSSWYNTWNRGTNNANYESWVDFSNGGAFRDTGGTDFSIQPVASNTFRVQRMKWNATHFCGNSSGTAKNVAGTNMVCTTSITANRTVYMSFVSESAGAYTYISEYILCDDTDNDGVCTEVVSSITINSSSYNVTSASQNATAWITNTSYPIPISDPTPSISFTTSSSTNASISIYDQNYTTMITNNSESKCSTTDITTHTCTLPSSFTLESHGDNIYISLSGNENITSTSGALRLNLNRDSNNSISYPDSGALIYAPSVNITYTPYDDDGDVINISLYTSLNSAAYSITNTKNNVAQGLTNFIVTQSYYNNSVVQFYLNSTDGFGNYNITGTRNFTINSVSIVEPTTYYQLDNLYANKAGTYYLKMRYAVGFNYSGNITEYQYNFNKTIIGNATNITIKRLSDSSAPPQSTNSTINVSFTSYNLTTTCNQSIYYIEFEAPAVVITNTSASCTGDNFAGTCTARINLTNPYDFQLRNISLFINVSDLPNWLKRTSIDIDYTNQTGQSNKLATGDVYCIQGVGGTGGGFYAQGEGGVSGDGSDYIINNTNATSASFEGALTDENVSINPSIRMTDAGLNVTNLKLGSTFELLFSYSYTEGISGSSGGGGGGGGGSIITYEVIGNISTKPKIIDVPVIRLPFGKKSFTYDIDVSVEPSLCYSEKGHNELSCMIEKDKAIVTYTPQKNVFTDSVQDRIVIKTEGGAQAFVPVTFRLINLGYYFETKKFGFNIPFFGVTDNEGNTIGINIFMLVTTFLLVYIIIKKIRFK